MKRYNRNISYRDIFIQKIKNITPELDRKIFKIIYGK